MRQEDRLNMAQFGWANGFRNMVFIAGRLKRNASNTLVFNLQQTPVVAQSIPVITRFPLADAFPDGSYISVFARLRGRTLIDDAGAAQESGVILQGLHTRFTNGHEVDPDVAQLRLLRSLQRAPADAVIDAGIKPMDIETPEEIKGFVTESKVADSATEGEADDPYAFRNKDQRLLRNGNHAQVAGVIGFMEYRDGGLVPGASRLQIYLQQNSSLEEAIVIRVYGKQAILNANTYRPGHAIYVSGEVMVDVKRDGPEGKLRITPYLKSYSIESAQTPHIKISPYPEWALKLYEFGGTDEGFAKLTRFVKVEPKAGLVSTEEALSLAAA